MKVVLSPNPYRDRGLKAAQAAEKILKAAGVETAICLPFVVEGGNIEFPKHIQFKQTEEELRDADILVCFGGDGTILHAAKDANQFHVPILGVNLGSVGFMAELELGELSMLSKLPAGKYAVEDRMMLDVTVRRDGKVIYSDIALNDAALTKGAVARVVDLEVLGDKTTITKMSADGVVISTPTGSTAYSMSAGDPSWSPRRRTSSSPPSVPTPCLPGPLCWAMSGQCPSSWAGWPARPPFCRWTAARPSSSTAATWWRRKCPNPKPDWSGSRAGPSMRF